MLTTVKLSLIIFTIGIFQPFATSVSLFHNDDMIANTNFDGSLSSRSAVYSENSGACRNMDGNYRDIGTFTADTALACQQKCDATHGCEAVSWWNKQGQYQNNCHLTSDMASSTFEANWTCYSKGYEGHRRNHIPSTCKFPNKGVDCCTFFDALLEGLDVSDPVMIYETWNTLFCSEREMEWKDFVPETFEDVDHNNIGIGCDPDTPGYISDSCGELCPHYGNENPCEDLITKPTTTTTTTKTPRAPRSLEDGVKKMSTIQLIEEDKYCPNFVQLKAPSTFDLNKCAEVVSLSKGKNGCHSTNGIFVHTGQDAGYCYCIKDDCTQSYASTSGFNIYKLSAVSSIDLYKEDMYCHDYTQLKSPSNFDLKSCAELVSLSKGKHGCQSTLDLFMHVGRGSGGCYCSTNDCEKRSASTSGLNVYRFSERICTATHTNYTQKCSELRIGGYVVINNRPCKIDEISKSKTDKDGYSEVHLVTKDIITKETYEDNCLSYQSRDVPNLGRKDYELIEYYVDENEKNIAVLIDPETGNRRTDLKLRSQDIRLLGTSYYAYINKIVTVLSVCGEEIVVALDVKEGEDDRKLMVTGIRGEIFEEQLVEYFEKFGELKSVKIIYDRDTNRPKNFGFITYKDSASAVKALEQPEHVINSITLHLRKFAAVQNPSQVYGGNGGSA